MHATSALVASHHRLADLSRAPGVREQVSAATEAVRARLRELVGAAGGQVDLRGAGPDAVVRLVRAMQWGLFDAVSQGEIAEEQAAVVATRSVLRALGVPAADVERLVAGAVSDVESSVLTARAVAVDGGHQPLLDATDVIVRSRRSRCGSRRSGSWTHGAGAGAGRPPGAHRRRSTSTATAGPARCSGPWRSSTCRA